MVRLAGGRREGRKDWGEYVLGGGVVWSVGWGMEGGEWGGWVRDWGGAGERGWRGGGCAGLGEGERRREEERRGKMVGEGV